METIRTRIARWLCPDVFAHRDIKVQENEDLIIKLCKSREIAKTLGEEVERLRAKNAFLSINNNTLLQRLNSLRPIKRRRQR